MGKILNLIISDQYFFGHVTHKVLNSFKFEIGQYHPIAFFFKKMISDKTWYKTLDGEFLAIVKAFKT